MLMLAVVGRGAIVAGVDVTGNVDPLAVLSTSLMLDIRLMHRGPKSCEGEDHARQHRDASTPCRSAAQ